MQFGTVLRMLRTEQNILQKELADYLNVSVGTISNYEKNIHYPDLATLCRLADYFNVSTDYLLGRTGYRYSLTSMDKEIRPSYTISQLLNTIIELEPDRQQELVKMVKYLSQPQTDE